jgi:hypothetical protein
MNLQLQPLCCRVVTDGNKWCHCQHLCLRNGGNDAAVTHTTGQQQRRAAACLTSWTRGPRRPRPRYASPGARGTCSKMWQWRRAGAWRGRRGRRCVGGPLRFCIGAQAAAGEIKEETLYNITVTVQNCTRLYTVMLGGLYTVISPP